MPRRLESTAPADPMANKRAMSGTGSLANGRGLPAAMQTAQTALGSHDTNHNGFNRKGTAEPVERGL